MKYEYAKFKEAISNLTWSSQELADRLSSIGHETVLISDILDVTLTSNRKDCQDFQYLVFDLCGVFSNLEQKDPPKNIDQNGSIEVIIEEINKLLGTNLESGDLNKLEKLGFVVENGQVKPPSFRTGIETVADVAEELLRVVGFEAITVQELSKQPVKKADTYDKILAIKHKLVEIGLFETQTYSFDESGLVEIKNPFNAQLPYMRSTLQTGLLSTASKNPYIKRINCFEIGDIFEPDEKTVLGILLTGQKNYDQIINQINTALNCNFQFSPVDSKLASKTDMKQPNAVWAQLPINSIPVTETVTSPIDIPVFKPISKFPPLVRDITLTGTNIDSTGLIKDWENEFPQLLFVEQIDSYVNPETKQHSETFRLFFQKTDSSFVEEEIRSIDQQLDKHFIKKQ